MPKLKLINLAFCKQYHGIDPHTTTGLKVVVFRRHTWDSVYVPGNNGLKLPGSEPLILGFVLVH